jgi:large subunit ribosomal protein L31
MKENIHPKYYRTKVTCGCGHTFISGSTRKELKVDVCAKCHPFYTGEHRMIDTTGRLERFMRKYDLNKTRGS